MKQNRKQVLLLVGMIGITLIMSFVLYHRMLEHEKESCWQLLENSAEAVTKEMKATFVNDLATLHLAEELMRSEMEEKDGEIPAGAFQRVCDNTLFSRIDVIRPGNETDTVAPFEEVSAKGEFMSGRMEDPQTGKQVLAYYIPVKKDEKVIAVLAGIIETDTLAEKFKTTIYDGKAVCCVIDSKSGDFIMDQWHEKLENAYEMQERKRLKGYEEIDLKQETRDQKSGVIAFQSQTTGKSLYMYYMPLQMFGWELEVFVTGDIIFKNLIYQRELLILAGAAELVLLCIYFFWNLYAIHRLTESKKETEEQLRISQTLIQCVTVLSDGSDTDTALQKLLRIVTEYFQADRSYIFSYDRMKKIFVNTYEYAKAGVTPQKDTMPVIPESILERGIAAFDTAQAYYIPDVEEEKGHETYEILKERGIKRLLAVPLKKDGEMTGFVSVDNPRDSYEDATLLSSIQFFISNSLAMKQHQEQLQFMSYWDSLTCLYNRNKYMQMIAAHKNQVLEKTGAVFLDLNGLKEINDRDGHEAGDALICSAARIISQIYPENAYRIGGDEFVIVLTDIEEELFEEKTMILLRQMKKENISISLGKVWSMSCRNLEKLLKEADVCMYLEKQKHYQRKTEEILL